VVRDLTVDVGDQVDMGERIMRVEAEGSTGGEGKD
jgi:pyruvate/2-oxoglutarate dehydrogenase complex dihydrolipoamide acyltransferase (E2) component